MRGADYQFGVAFGTYVIIPAGSTQLNIPINPIDDTTTEVTETVKFELDDETSSGTVVPYSLGNDKVTLNLLDNESLPPHLSLEIIALDNDAAETLPGEPPNTAKFLYRQSGSSGEEMFMFLSFAGSARQGVDYNVLTGP